MARIFISYSRVDKSFTEDFAKLLKRGHQVFYDDALHGGQDWWQEILDQIGACDIFIYLLSEKSVASEYCRAEYQEAYRLRKQILPVLIRARTDIPSDLSNIHYEDLSNGLKDVEAFARVTGAIQRLQSGIKRGRPRTKGRTPAPHTPVSIEAEKNAPLPANIMFPPPVPVENTSTLTSWSWSKQKLVIGAIAIALLLVGAYYVFIDSPEPPLDVGAEETLTAAAQIATDDPNTQDTSPDDARATGAAQAYATLSALAPTDTPTITPTPSDTPISSSDIEKTTMAEIFATETGVAGTKTAIAQETQNAVQTQQSIAGATATYIVQLSLTPPTATNTSTPTRTPLPTNTSIPRGYSSDNPVTANNQWTPIERPFNGVTMVLVPAGCFDMGSRDDDDEQPVHEQCFDKPFWIDKYEVTQAQFMRLNGTQVNQPGFSGDGRPMERITWFEARDFCELRDTRLPTEAEWEYAARGPDNLVYPWSNSWNANNVVWNRNSSQGTVNVGSIPAGISWVGALDMSGNVWEWTSSLYEPYPYNASDGREADTDSRMDVRRVLRGGSWYNLDTNILRAPFRYWSDPYSRTFNRGFRCARSYE